MSGIKVTSCRYGVFTDVMISSRKMLWIIASRCLKASKVRTGTIDLTVS